MTISEYCCLSIRVEQVEYYYCVWNMVIDFLQMVVTVKLISYMLNPTKSPTLINWKLMANRRLVTQVRRPLVMVVVALLLVDAIAEFAWTREQQSQKGSLFHCTIN